MSHYEIIRLVVVGLSLLFIITTIVMAFYAIGFFNFKKKNFNTDSISTYRVYSGIKVQGDNENWIVISYKDIYRGMQSIELEQDIRRDQMGTKTITAINAPRYYAIIKWIRRTLNGNDYMTINTFAMRSKYDRDYS